MNENEEMDLLDRRLREAAPYLDDAGFTRRVLQALPAPRRRGAESFRAVILLGITLLGSALAYVLSDGARFVSEGLLKISAWSPLTVVLMALGAGILVTGFGVAAALAKSHELES